VVIRYEQNHKKEGDLDDLMAEYWFDEE